MDITERFGLPPEFVAAVVEAEDTYDEDLINVLYDVSADYAILLRQVGEINQVSNTDSFAHLSMSSSSAVIMYLGGCVQSELATFLLSGYHEYFGIEQLILQPWFQTSLKELGLGYGSAPGLGNIHAGTAKEADEYFALYYSKENLLPIYAGSDMEQK
jgi:hypothetical protein